MAILELDQEEAEMLEKVLEKEIADLRVEIRHSGSSECRELLRNKEGLVEKVLSSLKAGKKV